MTIKKLLQSEKSKSTVLLLSSLLLALLLCEGMVRFLGLPKKELKQFLQDMPGKVRLDCYSSQPADTVPLNFRKIANAKNILHKIAPNMADFVIKNTPYCIKYDQKRRLDGTAPQLSKSIVLLGDSFTFGEGLSFRHTLGAMLAKHYPDLNFKNHGYPGNNIKDIQENISTLLRKNWFKNIQHFLYFYNLNDVLETRRLMKRRRTIINDFQNIQYYGLSREIINGNPNPLEYSKLFMWLRRRFLMLGDTKKTVQLYLDAYFSKENAHKLKETFHGIKEIDMKLKSKKKRFTLLIYPLLYKAKGVYPFQKIHKKLLNFCKEQGIHCVDILPAFAGYPSLRNFIVHPIDFHPNSKANRIVTNYIKRKNILSGSR